MFLRNGNFEQGASPWWRPVNNASAVSLTTIPDRARAKTGTRFLRMRTTTAGGSVAQDISIPGLFSVHPSLALTAWLRAAVPFSSGIVQGSLFLWAIGPNQYYGDTSFSVSTEWTQVCAILDLQDTRATVRAEIYLQSVNQDLEVDGVTLV